MLAQDPDEVRRRRRLAGLAMEQLATKAGLGRTAVWKTERGVTSASAATLHALAAVLGCGVEDLLAEGLHPLVRLRIVAGLTQEQLAFRARVGKSTVSRAESEAVKTEASTLQALARALGCEVEDLRSRE